MFFNDHPPPHFHARYGEFEVTLDISTQEILEGQLPRRALNLVQEWAMMHKEELLENWRLCREKALPSNIDSGAVAWPGNIDLAPDAMYAQVAQERSEQEQAS